jgi:uncharacterized protein involved in exopolysaccharide biosynthesis
MARLRARRARSSGRPRVTPGPLDAYLSRLARELRQRGLEDRRIVAEAREHLIDAIEDGRQRGLSVDEAEREAFERFGAPEIVAAHVVPEREHMMNRFAAVVDTMWNRKWWILAPTVLTAVMTSVMSYYFLPTRYRSESSIRIVPSVPVGDVRQTAIDRSPARFLQISQSILSRTHLERIIRDFELYQVEQERAPFSDVVLQMQRDISLNLLTSDHAHDNDVVGFSVSFVSADPKMAMKITERLASIFIDEAQFRIIDAARLPERPLGPSRLGVNVAGTFAGLGLGLAFVGVRSRSKHRSRSS